MFDERDTAGRPPPTSRIDGAGNRYEMRRLASGERLEIIKNFYDWQQLSALFTRYGCDLVYQELEHFWVLNYQAVPIKTWLF